jgi:hypothetical protein
MSRTWVSYYLPLCLLAAACADRPPEGDAVESKTSELNVFRFAGQLMPFGGFDRTCATLEQGKLRIHPCNGSNQHFTFNDGDGPIFTSISQTRCVGGNLTNGIVSDVACIPGDINQTWKVREGRVIWGRTGPAPSFQPYCLDVRFGSHADGAELGVVPCNNTQAQAFFVTNFTTRIRSFFSVSTGPGTCDWECLDILFNQQTAGTGLDNFNCNGTDAQWFEPHSDQTIRSAKTPSLCITVDGPIEPNGVAPVALQVCGSVGLRDTQHWFYELLPDGGTHIRNVKDNLCLDIRLADPMPGTPIVAYACNNQSNAQRWSPQKYAPCTQPE